MTSKATYVLGRSIRFHFCPACRCVAHWRSLVSRARHGSQSECFGHSRGQVVLGHRRVDLDGRQLETLGFLAEEVGEHAIALEEVPQGPLRVAGLREKSPRRAP